MDKLKLVWKRELEAKGSAWKVKCAALSENDLLVLGSNNNEDVNQLFICDLTTMEWSSAPLIGDDGPSPLCDYHFPIISEENDGLLVFWTSIEMGIHALLVDDVDNGEGIVLSKGESVVLFETSSPNDEMILCMNKDEVFLEVPKTQFLVEEENNFFETFERSVICMSFLSFSNGMQWSRVLFDNDQSLKARREYTCTKIDQKVYFFGGISDCGTIHNDMYILDLVDLKWKKCLFNSEEDKPTERYGHSATLLDNQYILIFGGNGYDTKFNDLYLFNVVSEEWSLLEIDEGPSPRSNHTFVRLNGFIVLFGGDGEGSTTLNDTFILDIEESKWLKMESTEHTPSPRSKHHCSCATDNNSLVFFAGENNAENLFDIFTLKLEEHDDSSYNYLTTSSDIEHEETVSIVASSESELHHEIDSTQEEQEYSERDPVISLSSIPQAWDDETTNSYIDKNKDQEQLLGYEEIEINSHVDQQQEHIYETSVTETDLVEDDLLIGEDPQLYNEENSLVFELDSHEFMVEGVIDSESNETDTLEVIFNYVAQGNQTISLFTMVKLCRNCRITENWLSYDSILETISTILHNKSGSSDVKSNMNYEEKIRCSDFRRIIADLERKRNINQQFQDDGHMQLLEGCLKPYHKLVSTTDHLDEMLTELYSPPIISLFSTKKQQIQQLFSIYSSLNLPNTTEVIRSNNGAISLAGFVSFAETFDFIPDKISRVALQKTIFINSFPPECNDSIKESRSSGLNYPQFLESLGRLAMHIYSKYPYSAGMVKTTKEKIEALFNHLGFKDAIKFNAFLKKRGVASLSFSPSKNITTNKPKSNVTTNQSFSHQSPKLKQSEQLDIKLEANDESKRKYLEMMQNKHVLKDELENVFMYYCSYGNRMNLDLMSSSKFKMFIRDTNIFHYGFKQEDADLIFIRVSNPKSTSKKRSSSSQKLSFPQFVDCVKEIASKLRGDISPTKAFAQFLLLDLLPNVQRLGHQPPTETTMDCSTQKKLEDNKKNLQKLFILYCNSDNGGVSPKRSMKNTLSNEDLFKFCVDFEIIPLISKKDVYRLFRSHTNSELDYHKFEYCFVDIINAAYGKHPYDSKYPSSSAKLEVVFQKMELFDWNLVRKRLEKIGRNIPVTTSIQINSSPRSVINRKEAQRILPKEEELDRVLVLIFQHAVSGGAGGVGGSNYMTLQDFVRLLKSSSILDQTRLSVQEAQTIYNDISSSGPMIFEKFCESLGRLSGTIFQERNPSESLKALLMDYLLPFGYSLQQKRLP